jgi:hypothetical protein
MHNLEMIFGNQAKADIEKELWPCPTCAHEKTIRCEACDAGSNYMAKEAKAEDLQNIVVFTGCNEHQRMFGDCDDPTHKCIVGHKYVVEYREVHSWHTKIKLQGMVGLFNSVCFEDYTAKEETVVQTTDKEDSVSTHKGAVDGSAPTFTCLCPGCGLRFGKECPVTKLAEALEHALEVIV